MKKQSLKKWTTGVLIAVMLFAASGAPALAPRARADTLQSALDTTAIACGLVYFIGSILSFVSFSALKVPIEDAIYGGKEMLMDCLFFQLNNVVIASVTDSILDWVQNGFDGNPAFETNLAARYRGVGDVVVSSLVDTDLGFLCSPFRAQVQLGLLGGYLRQDQFRCTLDDVTDNVEGFLGGDFRAGGWDAWFELVRNPQNTPDGAAVLAQIELSDRLTNAIGLDREQLQWGGGFLSKKRCELIPAADGVGPPQQVCRTVTPGVVAEEQLNEALKVPGDRLKIADEINEIIGAVVAYLVSDILRGDEGLAGYDAGNFTHELPTIEIPDIPIAGDGTGGSEPFDSEPAGAPGASTCFARAGDFHTATAGDESIDFALPLSPNTSYDTLTVEFDVDISEWNPADPSAYHNIFWLRRDAHRNLFGYLLARGPAQNKLVLRHGIGQRHQLKPRIAVSRILPENKRYHVRYVYDAPADEITATITNARTGGAVATLSSVPDVPGINVGREQFRIAFGFDAGVSAVELPSYGWTYSDLRVEFTNNGESPTTCETPSERPIGGGRGDDRPPADDEST